MLQERNVEVALFEIKKAYEYFRDNLESEKYNGEFALLVYNNTIMLGQPYEQIRQAMYNEQNDAQYIEYCQRMKKIVMEYIDRDEQGNPQFDEHDQPKVTEMAVEYGKACDALDNEYKELNERMQGKDEANFKLLKQKVKIKICAIDVESIPHGIPPSIVGFVTKPNIE